jgi:PAS domain-containing protein
VSDFDLVALSLGAGVQSTALLLMACAGEFDTTPDVAIFADTQDESRGTMEWLARLEAISSIPIERVTVGRLSDETLRSMRETESGFCPIPTYVMGEERESQGRRQCTRTHKLEVINQAVRRMLGAGPGEVCKGKAEVWIGISTDEAHRAKPSLYRVITSRWPLLFDVPMRRSDCAEYVRKAMGTVPPRSACVYCPFKSDREWIAMKRDDRESFDAAVDFEKRMRAIDPRQYLHSTCVPIADADFDPEKTLDMFGEECSGICGV